MCRGGEQFIFSVWSLTHCHSWNNLLCIHNTPPSSPTATDNLLQPSPSSPKPPVKKNLRPFNPLQKSNNPTLSIHTYNPTGETSKAVKLLEITLKT